LIEYSEGCRKFRVLFMVKLELFRDLEASIAVMHIVVTYRTTITIKGMPSKAYNSMTLTTSNS